MLDINDVTIIGTVIQSFKYTGANFDALTLVVKVGDSTFKVKSSGDKTKFFNADEYKGTQIMALGRIKLDEYNKKDGTAVKEYVVDTTATKLNILQNAAGEEMAQARVGGKIVAIKNSFIVLACTYMGGTGTNREFKERKVLISLANIQGSDANIPDLKVGHNYLVVGSLTSSKGGAVVMATRCISAFSKSLK